jgi:hypothetical protein
MLEIGLVRAELLEVLNELLGVEAFIDNLAAQVLLFLLCCHLREFDLL